MKPFWMPRIYNHECPHGFDEVGLAELASDFVASAGPTVATAAAGSAVSYGLNKALGPKGGGVNIPPPPGAAMIDPEGARAAAMVRQRQAVAGGLNSTVTGAGQSGSAPAAGGSATSGGKQLLGQ